MEMEVESEMETGIIEGLHGSCPNYGNPNIDPKILYSLS